MDIEANTTGTFKIGPFVDETDGKTAETGLSIAQADVRLSKNGGDIAQKTEATACTHDEIGVYGCPYDATDTNTEGILQLWVHESGALPVFHEYMVLAQAAYISKYTAKDTGYMDVDAKAISGATAAADNVEANIGNLDAAVSTVDTVVDGIQTDLSNVTDGLGALKALIDTLDTVADAIKAVTDLLPNAGTLSDLALEATLTAMKQIATGTFNRETDSLQAIRDRGDAAWTGGGAAPTVEEIDTELTTEHGDGSWVGLTAIEFEED